MIFLLGELQSESRNELWSHIDVDCSFRKLARTGLKTIVVMAGGCALQTSPQNVSHAIVADHENSAPNYLASALLNA